ncbi:hypothetical protein B0H14DRAFT_403703 [Mycena olivaceomarginata]|nr:hypothetical protein B0H14DRAFT_403703 [Mycena olivaceomarginata]
MLPYLIVLQSPGELASPTPGSVDVAIVFLGFRKLPKSRCSDSFKPTGASSHASGSRSLCSSVWVTFTDTTVFVRQCAIQASVTWVWHQCAGNLAVHGPRERLTSLAPNHLRHCSLVGCSRVMHRPMLAICFMEISLMSLCENREPHLNGLVPSMQILNPTASAAIPADPCRSSLSPGINDLPNSGGTCLNGSACLYFPCFQVSWIVRATNTRLLSFLRERSIASFAR